MFIRLMAGFEQTAIAIPATDDVVVLVVLVEVARVETNRFFFFEQWGATDIIVFSNKNLSKNKQMGIKLNRQN
jgi:hypothetical protein